MTLSKHVNAEKLENKLLQRGKKVPLSNHEEYISRYDSNIRVPKYQIPETSTNGELIYELINKDLSLDGNPTLNLASFVNTEADPIPLKLITENIVKNLADNDEYPSLIEIQQRCISMISNLWNAPKNPDYEESGEYSKAIGTATTGSSEAIMLGGLAMKKKWQQDRAAQGKDVSRPNIIMASHVQVALEKFARYFDVENRLININAKSDYLIDLSKIEQNVDENTIGIFVVVGSTYTGSFESVEKVSKILDDIQARTGLDIPIHVDGASGGFIAPFAFPDLAWDFRIPRVVSINTSGHKFGLTTAGLGWVLWKEVKYLPSNLRFQLDYLGGVEETFNLNFSRPGFPVIHQYYNFLTFGKEGYTKKFDSCLRNARLLSDFLEDTGYFECLSQVHRKRDGKYIPALPVVAFRLSEEVRKNFPEIPQTIVSSLLRNKGFIVPNYHLPPDEHDIEILRVVVRDSLTLDLLDKLMKDLVDIVELLMRACGTVRSIKEKQFIKGVKTERGTLTEEDKKVDNNEVYQLLLSIASTGLEDLKVTKNVKKEKHINKGSYRGPC